MKIACLGDSITVGIGVPPEARWISLVSASSDEQWFNYAVVGDTLPGMLSRLDSQISPQKPDIVFLLGGWNDLLLCGNMEHSKSCLIALVHHCVHAGVVPVVGIPFRITDVPAIWKPLCPNLSRNQSAYLSWLRQLCATLHLRTVDLDTVFGSGDGLFLDGVHPNTRGHQVIAQAVIASGYFDNRM